MTREDESRTSDDDPALAETRIVADEDPGIAETKVVEEASSLAETKLEADEGSLAETKLVADDPQLAETVVTDATAETLLSADPDDDAATQLVDRGAGDDAPPGAAAEKPTRLLDPAAPAAAVAVGAAATRRLPDTRVLDAPADKTAPPPVRSDSARVAPPTPIDPDRGLAPGTILFGEYEIVNVLGVGGMGEVYRARHRRLGEHRAIKVMHAELSKKKGASEFFYREAKALLAVRHPAVVHCHDLLSDDHGRVYLIMEMIEGVPLSKKMNDGPLSPDDVAILGARVAHGLAAAHRKGVIHRDLSPDNIVLPNGRVQEAKIIDFGIAKLLEEGEGTIVDGFKGKLSYASPEQLGFHGGKIDGRSDFYSLGLVLVAAALGRPMQMGTTVVEAVDARRGFTTLPDEIPIGLRSAIQPLLALDPDDRPRYVDRLFVVPGGVEGATDPGAYPVGGAGRDARAAATTAPGGRAGLIAGTAAAAALLVGGGLYLGLGGGPGLGDAIAPTASRVEPAGGAPSAAAIAPIVEPASPGGSAATTGDRASGVDGSSGRAGAATAQTAKADAPPAPVPRKLTARDRLQIIGLISNARRALEENRLMSPAGDNAFDRYRKVLELDPSDARARDGLRDIATRYVSLAERALDRGDLEEARGFVDRARKADGSYAGIDAIERRLVQ